jgi:solute carrier family 35 protein F1/2
VDLSAAAVLTMTEQQSGSPAPSQFEDEANPASSSISMMDISRPPVQFGSPSVFLKTLWARFASIWTKRFVLSVLAGQLVSLCITCTNVATTELVNRGWALPTTQTLFLWVQCLVPPPPLTLFDWLCSRYSTLFVIYTPYTIYKCE